MPRKKICKSTTRSRFTIACKFIADKSNDGLLLPVEVGDDRIGKVQVIL